VAEDDQDDKSELPSQKKIDDARAKGDVPRSVEINSWFMLAGAAFIVSLMANGQSSSTSLSAFMEQAASFSATKGEMTRLSGQFLALLGHYLALPFGIAITAAVTGPLLQHIPTPSMDHLMPKLSRVSPASGLSRVVGKDALAQALKSFAKLMSVGGAVSIALWAERDHISHLPDMELSAILDFARAALMHILIAVLAIHAFVAGGDYLFQWFSWQKRLMMSKQDMKDEHKQQEGSPEVKNKIRQLRRDFSRRVMMGNVKKATVVIANPTHFAVALEYKDGMQAPICVAKGVDVLALRIRKLAEDHDVPVIEDVPLARSLYRVVEIDAQIPLDLYKPVAEIIGYVMRLRQRRAAPRLERQMREP